jgi:perosamine synthetase
VLPVHILGHPCDLDAIVGLADRHGLQVVEDATESLGARYKDRQVGGDGRLACLSFNGNKLVTSGGGGMIVTSDEGLARRAKYLTTQAKDDAVEFVHGEVGFNYRLTNVQAAIGCAQLERLEEYLLIKRVLATRYRQALANVSGVTIPSEASWASSAWWLFTLAIDPERFGCDSRTLMARLRAGGIETRPLWQPLHLSPPHRDAYQPPCPVAEDVHRTALSIPCSVGLAEPERRRVVAAIRAATS